LCSLVSVIRGDALSHNYNSTTEMGMPTRTITRTMR
jgi:hypothetical protein